MKHVVPPDFDIIAAVQKAGRVLPYVVLLLWTIVLYFPAIDQPFVYDDKFQIVNNPKIQNFQSAKLYLRQPMEFAAEFEAPSGAFYRPLFWMSIFAD